MNPAFDPAELSAFLAPGCDRLGLLEGFLKRRGCEGRRLRLAGSEHLAVRFAAKADRGLKTRILIAHYDRAEGTPGALDNSAACLQLVDLAGRVAARGGESGLLILFTDAEERAAAGPRRQGAYALGKVLSGKEGPRPAIFAFDVCGRGDTPIVSESPGLLLGRGGLASGRQGREFSRLRDAAFALASEASGGRALRLAAPWTDDLGLTLGGQSAVALTLLPQAEALALSRRMRAQAEAGEAQPESWRFGPEAHAQGVLEPLEAWLGDAYPPTWRLLHGPRDDAAALQPEAFALMARLLDAFATARLTIED